MTFRTYPKIRRMNDLFGGPETPGYRDLEGMLDDPEQELVIQEKIDGANCRFMITTDGDLIFGSRNRQLDTEEKNHQFTRFIEEIRYKLNGLLPERLKELGGTVFFGEGCWKHSTSYHWENMPIFLGFDIFTLRYNKDEEGYWWNWSEAKECFENLGLKFVPVIKTVLSKDLKPLANEDVPKSVYSNEQAEGIVIKNYKTGQFGKYVTEKHREENLIHFGGGQAKDEEDDTLHLVSKFCSNQRVDKIIFKLLDEGNQLGLQLMQFLPKLVIQDIWDEAFESVYFSRKKYTIDFGKYKKLVGKRCKVILQDFIEVNQRDNYIESQKEEITDKVEADLISGDLLEEEELVLPTMFME